MSFAHFTAEGIEHADWSGLGLVLTSHEEQRPRVEEDSSQPEYGWRDGDQAETVDTQHPVCFEPELLFLSWWHRYIKNPDMAEDGWKVGNKLNILQPHGKKAGYFDLTCPRTKSRKISWALHLLSPELPLTRSNYLALQPQLPAPHTESRCHLLLLPQRFQWSKHLVPVLKPIPIILKTNSFPGMPRALSFSAGLREILCCYLFGEHYHGISQASMNFLRLLLMEDQFGPCLFQETSLRTHWIFLQFNKH